MKNRRSKIDKEMEHSLILPLSIACGTVLGLIVGLMLHPDSYNRAVFLAITVTVGTVVGVIIGLLEEMIAR